ncbi:hypothetical protein PSECIP111951_01929 [Pseudoalteromonas holothuriae]|uniref:DUF2909 domain-containing protein n=1 Tax=Pseudoalteromonas holothuriae TaxID=2963714 RepID=A0A9W4W2F7_9GAMM|nr:MULTISPECIES: DUF2909 family protein [unclassified Pseudoalteromonas]CAH9054169.1 hypothetical protein PSECIP111854_01312 [Pseudoalteromonas sp. CIP111854]CAH9058719.1 hypothetical protein PSECIP111951_01929 [Pseudoalteromonas sp. CIP111951]
MLIKFIIIFLLLFIIFNLFRALFLMLQNPTEGKPMSLYLGRRVIFSAVVLIIIIIAAKLGAIQLNRTPSLTAHIQIQINITKQRPQNANTKQLLERQNVV